MAKRKRASNRGFGRSASKEHGKNRMVPRGGYRL